MDPVTRKEMFLAKAAGQNVTTPVPITREEMFLEKIAENGGASSWNDLKDKPFGAEIVVIVPETTLTYTGEESDDENAIPVDYPLEVGKEYTVKYNGVEYVVSNGFKKEYEDEYIVSLGNLSAIDGSMPDTGEPFVVFYAAPTAVVLVMPVADPTEPTEITVSITTKKVTPIEQQYVTNALPYWIVVTGSGTEDDPFVCNNTVAEVEAAIAIGRDVKLRRDTSYVVYRESFFYHLFSKERNLTDTTRVNYMLYFGRHTWVSNNYEKLFLLPQEDGTYVVSSDYNVD